LCSTDWISRGLSGESRQGNQRIYNALQLLPFFSVETAAEPYMVQQAFFILPTSFSD
jgi:hypothetical protein